MSPIIEIDNLQVKYKDHIALDIHEKVTFYRGECIGVLGNNGAGKTTFINACIGGVPYSGNISTPLRFQDMAVHLQENIYISAVSIQSLIETILETSLKDNTRLVELIEFFSFQGCLKKKFKHLSGGEKQKLTLILVMMQNKELIFFDEITSGLDFLTRQELVGKIKEWYQNTQSTLFFVSHYYDELENFTDTLMILDKGRLIDYGKTKELFKKYCGHSTITVNLKEEKELSLITDSSTFYKKGWHTICSKTKDQTSKILEQLMDTEIEYRVSYLNLEAIYTKALEARGISNEKR